MNVVHILSADDPRCVDYRDLTRRARDPGIFVVESALVVERLLARSRFRVRSVLVTEAAQARLGNLLAGVPTVLVAADAVVRAVVGFPFHRGCVAVAERGPLPTVEALLAGVAAGPCLLVGLDGVANEDNVGAVFRNAAAFGADALLLAPGCGDPLARKAIRASMASSLLLPFTTVSDWPAALGQLRAAGIAVAALTPEGARDVAAPGALPDRLALLVGAEGPGLGTASRAAADLTLRIRLAPGMNALNVATATAIALHRLREARG